MDEQPDLPAASSATTAESAQDEPDWAAYYRYTAGRAPRDLFERARAAWAATGRGPGQAIEVGFGDGTETAALLAAGWHVLAIDAQQSAAEVLEERVRATERDRLEIVVASAETVELPRADLVYSGFTLPYLGPGRFSLAWPRLVGALAPGGLLVANLFGVHDDDAGASDAVFFDRSGVEALLEGLEVVRLDEHEEDSGSFNGPKHWHLFDIVARAPGDPAR